MLQEMNVKDALKKYIAGHEVKALIENPDKEGRQQVVPMELLFNDIRFLVNVPAVKNPDFEEAAEKMQIPPKTEEGMQSPPRDARGRRSKAEGEEKED